MYTSGLLALAATIVSASAGAIQGFNYGSTHTDGSAKTQQDFQNEFSAAQKLAGTNGAFTSARLYTMIQAGTSDNFIEAIPAAIQTKTRLLLGMWASAGQATITNEINALDAAIKQFGTSFTSLIDGISVGSEDLYRVTPTSISNDPQSVGASPDDIVNYIKQVKDNIASNGLKTSVGHVDTWTAWVNSSNSAVVDAADWIGVDAYPYFQTTMANSIDNGAQLFMDAYQQTKANAKGKPVWVTETGWPISGAQKNQAVAGTTEAETYWQKVGCAMLFGQVNTYWYTLNDASPTTPSPSFGLIPASLSNTPAYDLTCSPQAKASASVAATASYNTASAKASGSAAASAAASGGAATTGPAGAGATGGSGSNGTASTFVASTAVPTGPSATGAPGGVHTGGAVANAASVAGVLGVVMAVAAAL